MSQLKHVVEPFGEVNVHPAPGGKTRVVATILMEPNKEGTQTGIALDGSGSMADAYGVSDSGGGFFGGLFGKKPQENAEAPPPAPAPATTGSVDGGKPSYSLQNVKGFGPLGPTGFWVGLARDKAAATPELIAEMRFVNGDWKVTALKPQV